MKSVYRLLKAHQKSSQGEQKMIKPTLHHHEPVERHSHHEVLLYFKTTQQLNLEPFHGEVQGRYQSFLLLFSM